MQMGLLCWCQGCFRGSSRRSSSHLKDFLRSAEGQGGGSGEHSGDSETESRRRARERGREEGRGRELTVPRGPVTISRVCSARREGWGLTQGRADWAAQEKGRGSDRK